jgi:hypothetical protein|uniref:Uncharacterized protein n=1 Tax=Zea mays TaxID=4577 RepID=A0A804PAQ8_MAIZE
MDMSTPLTGNDDLKLTSSYFRYHIRETCCSLLLPSTDMALTMLETTEQQLLPCQQSVEQGAGDGGNGKAAAAGAEKATVMPKETGHGGDVDRPDRDHIWSMIQAQNPPLGDRLGRLLRYRWLGRHRPLVPRLRRRRARGRRRWPRTRPRPGHSRCRRWRGAGWSPPPWRSPPHMDFSGGGGGRSHAEPARWLEIARKLLVARDLVGCKRLAERAVEADPYLPGADELLTVADVLLASQRLLPSGRPNPVGVLQLQPAPGLDPTAAKRSFHRLSQLVSSPRNPRPAADTALHFIQEAFADLSSNASSAPAVRGHDHPCPGRAVQEERRPAGDRAAGRRGRRRGRGRGRGERDGYGYRAKSWSEAAAPGCRAKENATEIEENTTEMENATGMEEN